MQLFSKPSDYQAFVGILAETLAKVSLDIAAFVLMPNHWHFVVRPQEAGQLATFFQRLTVTHAMRWQRHRRQVGHGHVYQGRFKSFPIQEDDHFYQVIRYVERNPLRANLIRLIADWRWSSYWIREFGDADDRGLLSAWPVPKPRQWDRWVQQPQTEAELAALRTSLRRGAPFGGPQWTAATARHLGLEATLRPRGRPRKPR